MDEKRHLSDFEDGGRLCGREVPTGACDFDVLALQALETLCESLHTLLTSA
jgi:hypothetical protein